ncbi:ABCB family ABC transporter ATP-binding protein/permease [Pseudohalocynthiibacter aestuariivivens]|jgi:ATP-binding cassette, subfamily B, heavy metal transporter|uniref:ABCB family ABC transporter ATP-binding protein/permease n=1 Tax=Pseudohalocynthiibacter aestuariivivens TaxID=1591409 RepID=A0ABV5JCE6_9RHOB|nr:MULTISPECIES: ABC transporter ATP-binding protein/permease [Pseudohalocynthiibacter]MBS9718561.1 ABC transporter ATP-binding protein/permease [Pseudohalocynthiibacter aestuariivivens]MCK0103575.1 ABC transporter ATP-binding protein/permease [Pseudohalocynthiibacter sp. F2068]
MRRLTHTDANLSDTARVSGLRTIKKVVPYLWPADQSWVKFRVFAAMFMLLLAKVVAVGTPFLYKAAVDVLAGDGTDAPWMLGVGAVGLTVAYGGARLVTVGFQQLRDVIFAKVGQRALRSLALETFRHMHRLSLRYHIGRKTGGLSRIIERGVKGVDFLLRFLLFSIGPLVLELLMISAILFFVFDVWYLAVVVVTISLYIWFTFSVTEWRVKIRKEMNDQDTDANQKAIDSLLNFETVKYFGSEEREATRYDASMKGYEAAALKTSYSLGFLNFGQSLLITSGLVGVMVMAAIGVQSGDLTVGDFVMVNAYMVQITMPLNFLGTVYREIRQALVDMGEMFDLLEQPAEIEDKPNAKALSVTNGEVSFDNVVFGYEPSRPILKGVSLKVKAGQTLAIVGPSGSGKSTIGRLLFRFYDVIDGALRIDGQDVRDVKSQSVHAQIGVVPQDTVLFNDTIYYNIAYGQPDASREEVEDAARAAKIHDFVKSLPDGYQTTVGERGLKLSGGEKQRVGIARTLLKNPPILLLDEATSALDSETERNIQDSLHEMAEGRTVITIAHRLSTIADADQIVVLENGVIVEQGRHEELLERGGRYSQMWHRQQQGEDDVIAVA